MDAALHGCVKKIVLILFKFHWHCSREEHYDYKAALLEFNGFLTNRPNVSLSHQILPEWSNPIYKP